MNVQLDQISKTEAIIKINLKSADYQPKVDEKLKEYSKKAKIKGFRPGKVPHGMIAKMYGKSILVEEVNQLVSRQVMDHIRDNKIQILGEPLPNLEKLKGVNWETAAEFDFEYSIGIAPEFDVTVDSKVKVDTYTIKVDKNLIDETVENVKKQFGEMTNPEVSIDSDSIYGTLIIENEENNDENDDNSRTLDLTQLEKKVAKSFVGVKSGDVVEFEPSKAFAKKGDSVQFLHGKEVKGKAKFEVKNINRVIPAELNQELFDKTFGPDQVKSEDEFRNKINATITENYKKETDGYTEMKIRDKIIENTKINLPDEFLKRWLLSTDKNQLTQADIDRDYPLYINDLKWSMIKNKIISKNDIKVEHEDVIEEAKAMIRIQFGSMGLAEQMEANIDAFVDNYLKGEEGKNYMKLHEKVFNDKAMNYIRENVTIKSKEVSLDEYKEKA